MSYSNEGASGHFTIAADGSAVTYSPMSGYLAAGASVTIAYRVEPQALLINPLFFVMNGGPALVTVDGTVTAAGRCDTTSKI